jgi:purine-binding chemotaxis protein CheW
VSENRAPVFTRAAELRDAFDRSFAEPLPPGPPPLVDFLAIRLGPEPYALRLGEIAGLYTDRKVTPVPGSAGALLGIAGFRGAIVPVYDLPRLLGHPAARTARRLVLAAGDMAAFAFAEQEGQLRLPPETIVVRQSDGLPRPHVREFIRTENAMRPIIDLFSVLDAVKRQMPINFDLGER